MTLSHLLSVGERQTPEKTALHPAGGSTPQQTWTYAELFSRARQIAVALEDRGLRKGDRVAFYLGNRVEFVTVYLALLELGAVMVPMNLAYRRRELAHILTDCEPRLVVTERERLETLEGLESEERASVEEMLCVEDLDEIAQRRSPDRDPLAVAGEEDAAVIMYTSGTTGQSKGAVLSHGNIAATVRGLVEAWEWNSADTLLLALPLFHVHGLVVGLHCALASGARVDLHRRFEAAAVIDELSATSGETDAGWQKPTLFFGVPAMYLRLVRELELRNGGAELGAMRLFCSGSAPLDTETFHAFERLTGHAILERYGMTETGMLLSNPYRGERRPGTVGTPLPGVSARIATEGEEAQGDASEGELLVQGDNVFAGYWRSSEKTAESFSTDEEGLRWFHTGDLASRDPETGYYRLLGRRTELILSGGFNIYPREIEEVLMAHPSINEAAVVGRPHSEWGETPMAYVVLDAPLEESEMIEHCRAEIASFKVPRRFAVVEELPRNALGKVQKHLLPDPPD